MMYLAFCTHIIHIYIYIYSKVHYITVTSWKIGESPGVAPVASVALTALGCSRTAVATPTAAKHCSLGGGKHGQNTVYILYKYIYIYIIFWNVALIVFLVSLPHFFTCQRPYYLCSLFVCILYLFSDDFCISLLPSSNARFPHTSSLRQALRERRLHGSIQGERSQQWTWDVLTFNDISSSFLAGWHLWATSSASRQRCQRDLTVLG